jgi:putative acetyltransferase
MTTHIRIAPEDPGQDDVMALLAAGERYGASLYPAESNHFVPIDTLRAPNVLFLVARDATGAAIGTGAVVVETGWGEIKRMWLEPAARGHGLSKRLLAMLEDHVRSAGLPLLRLETGIHNAEALALYERSGFVRIGPFGTYTDDPLSVFMEKAVS